MVPSCHSLAEFGDEDSAGKSLPEETRWGPNAPTSSFRAGAGVGHTSAPDQGTEPLFACPWTPMFLYAPSIILAFLGGPSVLWRVNNLATAAQTQT